MGWVVFDIISDDSGVAEDQSFSIGRDMESIDLEQ